MNSSAKHPTLHHKSLNATLTGIHTSSGNVVQFRGVKFATIPERFSRCTPIDDWGAQEIDCTSFGPRCPQIPYDLTPLFRTAAGMWEEPEDEFECLNLSVTAPAATNAGDHLPVLIWIHGGGFVITVPSVKSGIADPTHLVDFSTRVNKPVIVVSINYRLGFFGFGYTGGDRANLGLFDQRAAFEWVSRHIAGFGGDAGRVTVAGESAGAISVHAHCQASGVKLFQRAVLMSGSMYTVPAQPVPVSQQLALRVAAQLGLEDPQNQEKLLEELRAVSAERLVKAQEEVGLRGLFTTDDGSFFEGGWNHEDVPQDVEALLIGDCQWESNLFSRAVFKLSVTDLLALFPETEQGEKIKAAYGIHPGMAVEECRQRTLDFMSDAKFNYPVEVVAAAWRARGKKVFRYAVDQPNPYEPEVGAHHTVDLLFLFGNHHDAVSGVMKGSWINFISGEDCWDSRQVVALGPHGQVETIDPGALEGRRRTAQFSKLRELGWDAIKPVIAKVVAGKIDFHPGL